MTEKDARDKQAKNKAESEEAAKRVQKNSDNPNADPLAVPPADKKKADAKGDHESSLAPEPNTKNNEGNAQASNSLNVGRGAPNKPTSKDLISNQNKNQAQENDKDGASKGAVVADSNDEVITEQGDVRGGPEYLEDKTSRKHDSGNSGSI